MGYKFQGICYDTLYDMHAAWSDYCQASGSGGLGSYFMACKADSAVGAVEVKMLAVSSGAQNGSTWYYNPPQISCDSSVAISDAVTLSWQLALILVTAFGFRAIIKAIYQN
ncbi:hypothetical protein [Nitrosomonas sp.]|uniref:hypothetical protein n=1 Tax=Nitrosomonas sp. TaxID=42353 RepID=UPI0025D59828|nr:hypothetical protein [Nitrosomonas sp.]MBV6446694.1 hypothetical protein [Nitrosomonas sp.]MBV6446705.1 hypothetical protein [Nitrosomonas sp.]